MEEEITYWSSRLTQTQKEADEAREKLVTALSSSLSQQSVHSPHDKSNTSRGDETDIEEGDAVFEDASEA